MADKKTIDPQDYLGFDDIPDTRPTIPAEQYNLKVIAPTLKTTKDKSGQYINYDAVVTSGPDAGYRIFRNIFSLRSDHIWRFKEALKAVGFAIPKGLMLEEAVDYFVKNANGFEFVGDVVLKPAQVQDEDGKYVDTEGAFQNAVKRWVSKVT